MMPNWEQILRVHGPTVWQTVYRILGGYADALATGLYQKTGDILLVKEALRHRTITWTSVYARADEERLRRAME